MEDNPADVRLTEVALSESGIPCELEVVSDGIYALEHLRRPDALLPDLILLDWNLPRMDGREVLRVIKQDETLRHIPVVVLTTSRASADVTRAYDLHANCFITKPVNILQFFEVIRTVENFWLNTATLPTA